MTNYPNIELITYKVREQLAKDKDYTRKLVTKLEEQGLATKRIPLELEVDMFPQIWGSTCGGNDLAPDGSPAWGGSAMTKEYTVVVHEPMVDVYVVCFGGNPTFLVYDANEAFLEDLKNRSILPASMASTRY